MPLTRYQIRNEYGLADPELYRAADKDDPEALLEGVAMAGLVGVLRQLGDLAEFAAEIFHDLHEEVMATAARGHGLMARVQQLEVEFPSVEKAFLTQTDQTPFFTNAGVDWHPNLRMEQNLITRGDLPRFVMESYEECRGPPRLFLLDKFDVAGAGACLKRYTDPSVFKVEALSSGVPTVEAQREKKNRKVKKKGSRWRNGETPEVVPASHAKLHELFLEERVENGHSDPARLVKLKRRQFNGFPFDPKPGKSYMERFLGMRSPEHKEVHEVSVNSSPLKLTLDSSDETGFEIIEIGTVSPEQKSSHGRKNVCSSPIADVTPELEEETFGREIVKVPDPIYGGETGESTYFIHKKEMVNGLAVEEDRETEGSLDGDRSDDFLSEVDNYMDALTTMESEMETDSEYKPKTDMGFLMVGNHVAGSDAFEEHLDIRANFSDSQSFGNSSMSDDGKSISRKGRSSFSCSDSLKNLAENTLSDEGVAKVYTLEDGVSEIVGSPTDHPPVHSVNQGNESTELTYIEECTAEKAPSVSTANLTVISSAQTELDEIPSYYNEFSSKSSYTDQKGIDLADSSVTSIPSQTLYGDNSLTEDCVVEELDHKDLDVQVSTADLSDLEEEVDDGSVNKVLETEYLDRNYDKILVEGKIGSPQSVTSPVSVNEEHQTNYANGVCDKEMVEEVGHTRLVILPSKEQPPSSVFPKSNVDSGVTSVFENSDFLQPVQIHSEVSNAINGKLIDLENLTETMTTPERDSIEEHLCSEIAKAEHDLGGATYPEENAKRFEEIPMARNSEQMDACTDKLVVEGEDSILFEDPVNYSDKSGSGSVNLDEHVDAPLVTVAVTTFAKYGVNDTSCLPSDSVGSNSSDFVNILDYTDGEELHQNGTGYIGVLPKSIVEPEEQKITRPLESASTELKSSTYESTSDGSLNPEVLDHIHTPHLTSETQSNSCFSDASEMPSTGLSNQRMESKLAYLSHSENACEYVMHPPTQASLEHSMELLAGQSYPESTLVALDETNSESLKLQHSHFNTFDSRTPEESLELQSNQHDFVCLQVDDTSSKSLDLQFDKTQIASDMGQERSLDASSKQEAFPSQELLVPSAVHEQCDTAISRNPFDSAFPSFGLVPENSEEMPPLPPLPPMQWRMGKFQPPSLVSQGQWTDHGKGTFLPVQPFVTEKPILSVGIEDAHTPNPFLSVTSDIPKSQHLCVESLDTSIQLIPLSSGMLTSVTDENSQHDCLPAERTESSNLYSNIPTARNERQEGDFLSPGQDPVESSRDTSSTVATVTTEPIEHDSVPSHGSQTEQSNPVISESTLEGKESENSSPNVSVDDQNCLEKSVLPPTTSEDQPHDDLTTVHGQTWPNTLALPPTYEVGKPNGSKLPRPRNPLIDAVAAHDKSKLRKVTERVYPQVAPKVDERNSLLEQIRTKSFNLKPTAVARPSIQGIQGPKTNLKVAAILEKANAIRQALTGSDEDEDTDSWSDS